MLLNVAVPVQPKLGKLSPLRLKLLSAAALPLVLMAAEAAANPLEFQATDSITLNGQVEPVTGSQAGTAVDILDSYATGDVSALTHVYGDQTGDFGARASGQGANNGDSWNVTGDLSMTDQIVNNTGSTQEYSLTFTINGGDLQAVTGGPGDQADANLSINIDFGPNLVASSTVDVSSAGGNPAALTTSGFSLGGTFSDGVYEYPDQTITVLLGDLGPGDETTLSYEMDSTATGQVAYTLDAEACEGGGGGGIESVVALTGDSWHPHRPIILADSETGLPSAPCEDSSEARSGDPTNLSNTPFSVSPVPEPSTLAVLAGGLALSAFRRRRRSDAGKTKK